MIPKILTNVFFLIQVKRTIEEKLYQILKGQDVSSDEEGSLTVMDLQNLVTTTASGSTVHVPS